MPTQLGSVYGLNDNPTVSAAVDPDTLGILVRGLARGLTDPFRKFTESHMAEYQPGVSVQDMPQTMQALPEVAMQTIGSPAAVGGVPGMGMGIRAYHGSPHDFDKFDLSKIGTGEGAQAYGHGLYFAENPSVAQMYRDNLSKPSFTETGSGAPKPFGRMYEVNINADPAQMLNWDSAVPKGAPVRNMIADEAMKRTGSAYADVRNAAKDVFLGAQSPELTGEGAYRSMSRLFGKEAASDALREAGIPGIKYLDQGSRAAGQGTNNYAVWNDKIIDILKKYGIALPGAGIAASDLTDAIRSRSQSQ